MILLEAWQRDIKGFGVELISLTTMISHRTKYNTFFKLYKLAEYIRHAPRTELNPDNTCPSSRTNLIQMQRPQNRTNKDQKHNELEGELNNVDTMVSCGTS